MVTVFYVELTEPSEHTCRHPSTSEAAFVGTIHPHEVTDPEALVTLPIRDLVSRW